MTDKEITEIKWHIFKLIILEDIREYGELLCVCDSLGRNYLEVAMNETIFCDKLCKSYRRNPAAVLTNFIDSGCGDENDRAAAEKRLTLLKLNKKLKKEK